MSKTLYQCRECRFIWDPTRGQQLKCARCGNAQYYEALDTWCFRGNEIAVERLRNVVSNLAIGAGLCRAHAIGEGSGYEWATRKPFWPRWEPGCKQDAAKAERERLQPGAFADIYGDRSKWRAP